MKWLAALAFLILIFVVPSAEAQPETLRVAIRQVKPFVFEEGGNLTGFSIDLWQEINSQLETRTEYTTISTVSDLLAATRNGGADLAISAISITEERERDWDFSQPMFEAGLQILVPDKAGGDSGGLGLGRILSALFDPSFLPFLALAVAGVVVAAHVVWFFERRREGGVGGRAYFPGIFEAMWWASACLATQADTMPRTAAARIVAVTWMFSAVLFIAFFTAQVTSSLTVQQLKGDIQGPDDLPGRRVATVRGSTSAEYLQRISVQPTEFNSIDDATDALVKGDADAVVYDAPVLLYYASHDGKGKVAVVGSVFRKENYGILFPSGSQLRKPVNEVLLRLRENGTYDRLYAKWFGEVGSTGKK